MLGIIDVGGGTRDIFGAGVLDYCLDHGIRFDYCLGVSAGASNLISYIAGQRGRLRTFYMDYAFRDEYMSFKNYRKTGNFLDMHYIFDTLSRDDGEYPLDFDAIERSDQHFGAVATDADTGRATYFDKSHLKKNNYGILAASACVPVVNNPLPFNGRRYVDGGLSDPIPIKKAREDGVERAVVILTRPKDFFRKPRSDYYFVFRLRSKYPKLARTFSKRAETYNRELRQILREDPNETLVIAPESTLNMNALKLDKEKMQHLYDEGYQKGALIEQWL
ncbi:MAG: patatin family protein [Peptoniphilus sp.]|nr:patatin family protein [Peptoniphilus sp.]MDD7363575.1 patatin family protein [Bacillota bacterium]MDY6045234.1 patatin family protein [Peptoniphilus sp.]